MNKVVVKEKFSAIQTFWDPKIAGELNGQLVKLVRVSLYGITTTMRMNVLRRSGRTENEFQG